MVVTPNQVVEMTKQERAVITKLEEDIDAHLVSRYNPEEVSGAGYPLGRNMGVIRSCVLEKLLNKYRDNNWDAKIEHDPREGDYICFKAIKEEARI